MDTQFNKSHQGEADLLRQRIEDTRADLSRNIQAIEANIDSGVEEAAAAVAAIVERGFERVSEGMIRGIDRFSADLEQSASTLRDSLSRSVDELASAFDLRRTAKQHPIATFTLTALVGVAVTGLLKRRYA